MINKRHVDLVHVKYKDMIIVLKFSMSFSHTIRGCVVKHDNDTDMLVIVLTTVWTILLYIEYDV